MKKMLKGIFAGFLAYCAILVSVLFLNFILHIVYFPGFFESFVSAIDFVLTVAICFLISGVIESTWKKPNWILSSLIGVGILVANIAVGLTAWPPIAFFILLLFFGGFIAYMSDRSVRSRYVIMFSIPAMGKKYGHVPVYQSGVYIDEEAKIAHRISLGPAQATTASFIIGFIVGITSGYRISIMGSIVGSLLGVIFAILFLMVMGTIIRGIIGIAALDGVDKKKDVKKTESIIETVLDIFNGKIPPPKERKD